MQEGGGLPASAVSSVFETGRGPAVPRSTSTVNANSVVLVERTIWQGFEAQVAIQKTRFSLSNPTLVGLFLLPSSTTCPLHRFLNAQTTERAEGQSVNRA